ncbi:MAG: hypothetical protein HZA50_02285 [Planctomycetes bacterium]|nr:hypothetical protein [Planctomycetota bacterium]
MMDMTFEQSHLLSKVRRVRQEHGRRMKASAVLVLTFLALAGYYGWQIHINWDKMVNQQYVPEYQQFQAMPPDQAAQWYGSLKGRLENVSSLAGPAFTAGALFYLWTLCLILIVVSMLRSRLDDRPRMDLIIALADRLEAVGELPTGTPPAEASKKEEK